MIGRITSFAVLAALISSFVLLSAMTAGPANAAADPGAACAAAKQKAAAKMLRGKAKCHGTALKKGVAFDPGCVGAGKLARSFDKTQDYGGCVNVDDTWAAVAIVDERLAGLLQALLVAPPAPGYCPQNGDDAACVAVSTGYLESACWNCAHNSVAEEACAIGFGSCEDGSQSEYCAALVNAVGCGGYCCPPPANAAADPGAPCAAAKLTAAAKMLDDKVKCHGTALRKGAAVDPACLSTAEAKFGTSFAKAEAKGECVTTADAVTIAGLVDDTLAELLQTLPASPAPGYCPQNGDGAACVAFSASVGCHECVISTLAWDACDQATQSGCPLYDPFYALNYQCASWINAAGCGDECCP